LYQCAENRLNIRLIINAAMHPNAIAIPWRSADRLKTFEGESYFHEAIFTLADPV